MYLIIAGDGQIIKQTKEISEEWLGEAENGEADIFDVSNPEQIYHYYQDGQWTEVENL